MSLYILGQEQRYKRSSAGRMAEMHEVPPSPQEGVVGIWEPVGFFYVDPLVLNEDGTFEFGFVNGNYELSDNAIYFDYFSEYAEIVTLTSCVLELQFEELAFGAPDGQFVRR